MSSDPRKTALDLIEFLDATHYRLYLQARPDKKT